MERKQKEAAKEIEARAEKIDTQLFISHVKNA